MKISAIALTTVFMISGCSEQVLEFNELEFGLSKNQILERYGEPLSIRNYRVPEEGDSIESEDIPNDASTSDVAEIWIYPARRTYEITDSRIEHRRGQAELYFSGSGRWSINQLGGYGWVSEEILAARESAKDT